MDRLVARRPAGKDDTFEYLTSWKDYGVEGDTWELEAHLPKHVVTSFDKSFDLRTALLWTKLRNFFYVLLTDSKEAAYGVEYTFDSTVDPPSAHTFLKFLAARRSGRLKIHKATVGGFCRTWLVVESMQDISEIVALHIDHPEAGLHSCSACPAHGT